MDYICTYSSPLGKMLIASDGEALTGIWFEGQKYYASTLSKYKEASLPIFDKVRVWLDKYFNGEKPEIDFSLNPSGSEFRQRVWRLLMQIPYGETVTYGQLANMLEKQTGRRAAAQAVGGAIGHNPISIIIPCHRVLGADGTLTGYAGGTDKKQYLLELEKE